MIREKNIVSVLADIFYTWCQVIVLADDTINFQIQCDFKTFS